MRLRPLLFFGDFEMFLEVSYERKLVLVGIEDKGELVVAVVSESLVSQKLGFLLEIFEIAFVKLLPSLEIENSADVCERSVGEIVPFESSWSRPRFVDGPTGTADRHKRGVGRLYR